MLANELVNYLAAGRQDDPLFGVGDDLVVSVEEGKYDPAFRFLAAGRRFGAAGAGDRCDGRCRPADGDA